MPYFKTYAFFFRYVGPSTKLSSIKFENSMNCMYFVHFEHVGIRIRMFMGLLDPDLFVRDPDRDHSLYSERC